MNAIAAASGLLAVALASALGGPSLSPTGSTPESRYTVLSGPACLTDARGGPETARLRCPGLGGAAVLVDPGRTAVGFAWPARDNRPDLVRAGPFGPTIEWRGTTTARGFEPYAAIVVGATNQAREMTVVRIRPGEACVVGTVALSPALDGDGLARALADARGRADTCPPEPARSADPSGTIPAERTS